MNHDITKLQSWINELGPVERHNLEEYIERTHRGQRDYGFWSAEDGRDLMRACNEELVDAVAYLLEGNRRLADEAAENRRKLRHCYQHITELQDSGNRQLEEIRRLKLELHAAQCDVAIFRDRAHMADRIATTLVNEISEEAAR